MNKKKITKLLTYILPIIYAGNFTPVFAEESPIYSSSLEDNDAPILKNDITTDSDSSDAESETSQENNINDEISYTIASTIDNIIESPIKDSDETPESLESPEKNSIY